MALSPGTRFGPYEIADEIGAGGMGVVYRATDTKLGRDVAIKTLPSTLAADTDRLARFEREAKLLAALNHPNIAVIYGLEEQEGTQCIAMELIEGETLEEKLKDGPLPVEDALRLALQIAQALEAAHEKGVVHRDLKPANVMVTDKGQVKVLDFGLAKAFLDDPDQASLGHSPALSLAMTQQGIVLGTASYMSPEQASGQATDQRADIWAFGVVLFEMLSGLPLFTGESVPHILADVLKSEPDWNRLPKTLHPRLKLLLDRCLEKKARNRYHAIADARIDIEEVLNDPEGQTAYDASHDIAAGRSDLRWVAASITVTATIAGVIAWSVWPPPTPELEPQPVITFDYDLPEDRTFRFSSRPVVDVSPDGRHFVYNADDGLYLRTMDELESRLIVGTESFLTSPTVSPDGLAVAYWDISGQLRRIAVSGGAPVLIADAVDDPLGMTWAADGTIFFGQQHGILRVSANGGTPEVIVPNEDGAQIYYSPRLLPDGDTLLFSASEGIAVTNQIMVQSLSTGERTVLLESGGDAYYIPTGHLVYALGDGLFAVAFDLDSLTISGGAVPLVQGVMLSGLGGINASNLHYDVSQDGTLVYATGGGVQTTNSLTWVDREGREERISAPPRTYFYPRISPDGTKVAIDVRDEELDIWTWDLARETLTRLTFDPANDRFASWSPDGQRIAFSSTRDSGVNNVLSVYWKASDGTGGAEKLAEGTGQMFPVSFTPDGTAILVSGALKGGTLDDDIAILSVEGQNPVMPLLQTPFGERNPEVSPDGRWLAYSSDESGQDEVYVRPFPNVDEGRWQVSRSGGVQPLWARSGQELFYRVGERMMSVHIDTEQSFVAGNPEEIFEIDNLLGPFGGRSYDVSSDGERFLMVRTLESVSETARIIVVKNWFEELKRLAPPSE